MALKRDEDLRRASSHLHYEWEMMRRVAAWLGRASAPKTDDAKVERNVYIEGFLVHVRNLTVFFAWHASSDDRDVRAHHFTKWKPAKPDAPWVEKLYEHVCATVVHLSYVRIEFQPNIEWPFAEIATALDAEMGRFVKLTPEHLLDERFKRAPVPIVSRYAAPAHSVPTGLAGPVAAASTDSPTSQVLVQSIPQKGRG